MADARAQVGAGLRRLREARSLSLSELARASGVAKATLSTLESGEANPTLDTLLALSEALHVSLGELVSPAAASVTVVRAGEGAPIRGASVAAELFDQLDAGDVHLEFFAGELGPDGQQSPAHAPGVIEHIFLTQGQARIGPVGSAVELRAGDYLRMRASEPHVYEAIGGTARLVMVMQYPRR